MSIDTAEFRPSAVGASFERAEFERNFQVVLPSLTKYARSLARDRDVAQDLVQEAALRAWAARQRFVTGTNFKAWCYRILRNCFLSQIRRQQVARTESRGDDLPEVPVAPGQEIAIEVREVLRAWPRLSPDHQRSLALVAVEGHSYDVAAAIDNVPLGTMKSRVTRARQALIAVLDGDGPPDVDEPMQPEMGIKGPAEMLAQTVLVTANAVDRTQVELLRAWRERRRTASMAIAA